MSASKATRDELWRSVTEHLSTDARSHSSTPQADQIDEPMRVVEQNGSPALNGDEVTRQVKRSVMLHHRRAMSSGSPDSEPWGQTVDWSASSLLGTDSSLVLPPHDAGDPNHQSVPIVVFAAEPGVQYVCRPPLLLSQLVMGLRCDSVSVCDWHHSPPEASRSGIDQWSLLSVAHGQFLIVLAVCSRCREKLQGQVGNRSGVDDAVLRGAVDPDGLATAVWRRMDPEQLVEMSVFSSEGGSAHLIEYTPEVSVLYRGLHWTLPFDVTCGEREPVSDPRAWDPSD